MLEVRNREFDRELIKPKMKIKIMPEMIKPEPKIQILNADFFEGTSIYLEIEDKNIKNLAQNALEKAGALIMTESKILADYIVADRPITIPSIIQNRSRGASLLMAAAIQQSMPRVILVKQIPWIYQTEIENDSMQSIEEEIKPMMVVSDGRHAPNFREILPIQLHFGEVPRGYFINPFEPIIPQAMEEIKKASKITNTPNNPEPPKQLYRKDWREFDKLADSVSEAFFATIPK